MNTKRFGFVLFGLFLVVQTTVQGGSNLILSAVHDENCVRPVSVQGHETTLCDTVSTTHSIEYSNATEVKQTKHASFVIHFRFAKSIVDIGYMDNRQKLSEIDQLFSRITQSPEYVIDSIVLSVKNAPDGSYAANVLLAKKRVAALKSYLYWKFPSLRSQKIDVSLLAENWDGLRAMVAADSNVPKQREALDIIDFTTDAELKEHFLRQLDNGKTFAYITTHFLRYLRSGASCVVWYHFVPQEVPIIELQPTEPTEIIEVLERPIPKKEAQSPLFVDETINIVEAVSVKYPCKMAVKTNVALLAAGVSNLGVEFSFGNHFSIDIPVVYSPYVIKHDYRLQVVALQPEFRYWLKEPMRGHFFGVHGSVGAFNIALDDRTRYQDAGPLWGVGVSYGYSLPLARHWCAEFTIGGGYVNVGYDAFYNIANGVQFDSGTKHYWGVTRLGINLVYKFNLK